MSLKIFVPLFFADMSSVGNHAYIYNITVLGQVLAESNKILKSYLELIYSIQYCSLFPFFKMSVRQ